MPRLDNRTTKSYLETGRYANSKKAFQVNSIAESISKEPWDADCSLLAPSMTSKKIGLWILRHAVKTFSAAVLAPFNDFLSMMMASSLSARAGLLVASSATLPESPIKISLIPNLATGL